MDSFTAKAAAALQTLQAARPDLVPARKALIGVSGGRDSVALLHWLVSLGWKKLVVVHLNHGLRGRASGQDAAFVRRLADRYGLKCRVARREIATMAKAQNQSVETTARAERDTLFQQIARRERCHYVFLAHHAEDQAETILANLLRGSAAAGLGGMKAVAEFEGGLCKVRPLLAVRRAEVDAFIAAHGLPFREDESNAAAVHRRNRLRHEVMPLLAEVMRRDVTPQLLNAARQAAADEACLHDLAARVIRERELIEPDGALRIPRDWASLPLAIQSRVLRVWLVEKQRVPGICGAELAAALAMLQPGGPAKINLPRGLHLRRKARRLWIERG